MKMSFLLPVSSLRPALFGTALCVMLAAPLAAQSPESTPKTESSDSSGTASETPEAAQLHKEYDEIQEHLETVQRQAEAAPEVIEEHAKLESVVRDAMLKEEPSVAPLLEKQDKLVAELATSKELRLPAKERSQEFQSKLQTFKDQRNQIQTVANKVADKPEIVSSKQKYQGVLNKEMTKVEPELPKLVERRDTIAKRYKELVAANR